VRSAVWLEGGARQAVHALKYAGLARIADDLADAVVKSELPGRHRAWLVPVPLGPKRLRERGYNQSAQLAGALARRWRRPVVDLLVRTRNTAAQTTLTPEARLANVAGAFGISNIQYPMKNVRGLRHSTLDIEHSTLIVVDDVFTTGATLAEAARALERAGAREILAVTFGRAVLPDFT
jgi:predicted amidophosphoribosyltransferase